MQRCFYRAYHSALGERMQFRTSRRAQNHSKHFCQIRNSVSKTENRDTLNTLWSMAIWYVDACRVSFKIGVLAEFYPPFRRAFSLVSYMSTHTRHAQFRWTCSVERWLLSCYNYIVRLHFDVAVFSIAFSTCSCRIQVDMCHVRSWWTWSPEQWTRCELVPSVNFSARTTSCSDRVGTSKLKVSLTAKYGWMCVGRGDKVVRTLKSWCWAFELSFLIFSKNSNCFWYPELDVKKEFFLMRFFDRL